MIIWCLIEYRGAVFVGCKISTIWFIVNPQYTTYIHPWNMLSIPEWVVGLP